MSNHTTKDFCPEHARRRNPSSRLPPLEYIQEYGWGQWDRLPRAQRELVLVGTRADYWLGDDELMEEKCQS